MFGYQFCSCFVKIFRSFSFFLLPLSLVFGYLVELPWEIVWACNDDDGGAEEACVCVCDCVCVGGRRSLVTMLYSMDIGLCKLPIFIGIGFPKSYFPRKYPFHLDF